MPCNAVAIHEYMHRFGRSSLLNPQGRSAAPSPRLRMRGTKAVSSHIAISVQGVCEALVMQLLPYSSPNSPKSNLKSRGYDREEQSR